MLLSVEFVYDASWLSRSHLTGCVVGGVASEARGLDSCLVHLGDPSRRSWHASRSAWRQALSCSVNSLSMEDGSVLVRSKRRDASRSSVLYFECSVAFAMLHKGLLKEFQTELRDFVAMFGPLVLSIDLFFGLLFSFVLPPVRGKLEHLKDTHEVPQHVSFLSVSSPRTGPLSWTRKVEQSGCPRVCSLLPSSSGTCSGCSRRCRRTQRPIRVT